MRRYREDLTDRRRRLSQIDSWSDGSTALDDQGVRTKLGEDECALRETKLGLGSRGEGSRATHDSQGQGDVVIADCDTRYDFAG
jgi:hypothetical protein